MRSLCTALLVLFGLGLSVSPQSSAQSCPAGQATTISGVVYAPNGTDPLPNVLVYIPSTAVEVFTPGVSCPIAGTPPSGNAIVGTTTAVDGSFTLSLAKRSRHDEYSGGDSGWAVAPADHRCHHDLLHEYGDR